MQLKHLFGRKVAIDASMCLYQFLIAVRQSDGQQLTNKDGETTSHLLGMFYRTLKLVENGIKPIYVFDGKPPDMKSGELEKRLAKREEAQKQVDDLKEEATVVEFVKYLKRTVKVTREQNEDAKKLLKLMGIPYFEAPCESEAQCAQLVKEGKAFCVGSEDMDTLCYGPNFLLRHLTFSESRKIPIEQIDYSKVLEGLEMDPKTFIELCILLGCDYCETIKGVGPATALKLIKKHGSIKNIVEFLAKNKTLKYTVPEKWEYKKAIDLFSNPTVTTNTDADLVSTEPDLEGLIDFMVVEKGFSEERVKGGVEKLRKALKSGVQGRLDLFFQTVKSNTIKSDTLNKKRKIKSFKTLINKKVK